MIVKLLTEHRLEFVREISYCLFFTADVNEAFTCNFASTCLDDLLYADSYYYEKRKSQRYPTEFKSNITYDTETPFLDLDLTIMNSTVHLKLMINGMILILK